MFVRGERMIDVINSTELRLAGVRVEAIGVNPATEEANDDEARTMWELNRDDEADQRIPFLGADSPPFKFQRPSLSSTSVCFRFQPANAFFESLLF